MSKFVKLFCVVIIAILIYFFVRDTIIPFGNKLVKMIDENTNTKTAVTTRKFDALKYRSEKVNDEVKVVYDKAITLINDDLMKNNEFSTEYDNIDNFYELQPYFLEYRLYLSTKYKIKDILSELPRFITRTSGLSSSGIDSYYNNNKKYLDEKFGIETAEELKTFIESVAQLKSCKEIKFSCSPDTIYHNVKEKRINIFCYLGDEIEFASVNFSFMPYYSTLNQSAPYVKVVGTTGGVS